MTRILTDFNLALACALVLLSIALIVLWVGPAQATAGGIAQKIFYFHVCSAWVSFLAFLVAMVCGFGYLANKTAVWDRLGASAIEVGMVFCTMVVCTGPVWARPVWGTWWTWEPRLLTFAIMWFTYAGYLMLRRGLGTSARRAPVCAAFAILASVNVPLVYFAVSFSRTGVHPKKIGLTNDMRIVLYTTLLAFTLLWLALLILRYSIETAGEAIERRRLASA